LHIKDITFYYATAKAITYKESEIQNNNPAWI